jgi:SAM-dependent methyltransferase
MGEYLASGFAGLDRVEDPAVYVDCLRFLGALPGMRAIKDESVNCLGLLPGGRALEVGCGLGVEATAMSHLVSPDGLVVALDASQIVLGCMTDATQDNGGTLPSPVAGDAVHLPFAAAIFDACRVERTLQHVSDPGAALAEMARVVRPGGLVLAIEPDWGTFVVDSDLQDVTRRLADFWCDNFRCGWIGRRLPRLLSDSGLAGIEIAPRPLFLHTLDAAEAVFALFASADRAVAAGKLSTDAARAFKAEQRRRDESGQFLAVLTFFMVSGRKPSREAL